MYRINKHNANKNTKVDFYVLSHGNNAGKPVKVATANCFEVEVTATEILLPEYFYYMVLAAYQAGVFKKYIKGSVIPFISLKDFNKAFLEHYSKP